MQIRKRVNGVQKLNTDVTDLPRNDVIVDCDEFNENEILSKYLKDSPIDNMENVYDKTYFATPGQCTRSKTLKLNPFDLSSPESKNVNVDNFSSSKRRRLTDITKSINTFQSNFQYMDENSLDSRFETQSSCESILSFAAGSCDENSNSSFSDISWPINPQHLLTKMKQTSNPVRNCSDSGYLLPIVAESSEKNIFIPQISGLTLANILSGNHTLNNKLKIFDCRFPYEYDGGHIVSAVNVYSCQKLLQNLFPIKESNFDDKLEENIKNLSKKLKRDDSIYVFYCEFSSYRAPKLAKCLRGLDRLAHLGSRDLFIPNVYILSRGYCDFYKEYPQFCSSDQYVPMKQSRYPLRNKLTFPESIANQRIRKDKKYFQEFEESEKKFQTIINESTKDSDILQLFLSHPIIGGS